MPAPHLRVEIAFPSSPDDPVQEWVDVTAYLAPDVVSITRGRSDERSSVEPGRMSLTLKNDDGRFTFGNEASPYYPGVVPFKRIRISVSHDGGVTWWPRFTGPVDGFPVTVLSPLSNQIRVPIGATDRLVRFGSKRKLRDPLAEELGVSSQQTGSRVG